MIVWRGTVVIDWEGWKGSAAVFKWGVWCVGCRYSGLRASGRTRNAMLD